ncbi:reverse transcriptase domain-containing protein [Mucilaginibacter sp. SJ]|uniref:reverse transcriptase domain-containing protein n=1 Tax=Mucilaginibacter sp. SJ TaxID=3029053 RepID=UPI0023A9DE64|nr:reverse transcriptase domain-containing protein [Mucilaginibacter sp. SJ]WEA01566.1 reverse transcriptase domain-containing protein [Mucilaginibacter sp. SJ]
MSFDLEEFIYRSQELGRGADFIKETTHYARNLIGQGLPVIFSPHHLAAYLDLDYDQLRYLIEHRNELYKFYEIKKKSGGTRAIVVPHANLRFVQQFIHSEILAKVPVSRAAFGFVKERSILHNAQVHTGKSALLNIDLFKFFDAVTEKRVSGIFRSLGYAKNLAWDLARLVTVVLPQSYYLHFKPGELEQYRGIVQEHTAVLPQGAATSPVISNIILRKLDLRLAKFAEKNQLSYSRYADDITFSGEVGRLPSIRLLTKVIREEGFLINYNKGGLHKKGRKQLVTSLTVSDGVHVHRKFKKEIAKHIYCCLTFGVDEHLKFLKMENKGLYKEWLLGKIYFVRSVEVAAAQKLMTEFLKIDWPS